MVSGPGGRLLHGRGTAESPGIGLHRLQAETLLHNTASQRVLARNGFRPFAVAPSYLKIAGEWQDHILYHLLNEDV